MDYLCYCRNCLGIKWLSSTWLWSRCGPVTASLRRCLANKLNIRCRLVYASDVSTALFTSVSFTIIVIFGCSGLVVEYRTRNREVACSTHPVHCKQPWASCKPTVCLGQLSLLPSAGWEMNSSYCGLWSESLGWLIEAMVCLLAALWVQFFVSAGNG